MPEYSNPFRSFGSFDFTKVLHDFKFPGVDLEAMLNTQRKNLEALTAANQQAVELAQVIAQRQGELLVQAMREASTAAEHLAKATNPQEVMNKQSELANAAFDRALAHMREFADMVRQANTEAFDVISKRLSDSLEELRAQAAKS